MTKDRNPTDLDVSDEQIYMAVDEEQEEKPAQHQCSDLPISGKPEK